MRNALDYAVGAFVFAPPLSASIIVKIELRFEVIRREQIASEVEHAQQQLNSGNDTDLIPIFLRFSSRLNVAELEGGVLSSNLRSS